MKYYINKTINKSYVDNSILLNIITNSEFEKEYQEHTNYKEMINFFDNNYFSKAYVFSNNIYGAILHISSNNLTKQFFYYYIDKDELLIIDDSDYAVNLIESVIDSYEISNNNTLKLFHDLITMVLNQNIPLVNNLENNINELEEIIQNSTNIKHYNQIMNYRRNLLLLSSSYHQLDELIDTIIDSDCSIIDDELRFLFRNHVRRVERLSYRVDSLKEYTLQLKDIYDTNIDTKQNKTINLLTILTSIFFPLSLLTSWYGMNFTHMPELNHPYSYIIIIIISILVVLIELLILKIKKII